MGKPWCGGGGRRKVQLSEEKRSRRLQILSLIPVLANFKAKCLDLTGTGHVVFEAVDAPRTLGAWEGKY